MANWSGHPARYCRVESGAAQVPSAAVLAALSAAAAVILPQPRMDYSFQVGAAGSWLLSEELPSRRAFALPPQEAALVTPPPGFGQKQLAGDLCILPQRGA